MMVLGTSTCNSIISRSSVMIRQSNVRSYKNYYNYTKNKHGVLAQAQRNIMMTTIATTTNNHNNDCGRNNNALLLQKNHRYHHYPRRQQQANRNTRTIALRQQQKRFFGAKKASTLSLTSKKRRGKKISMVTAYDYPSAVQVARAGMDMILVGDSVAMVELGHETTQPMTMDKMIHHCKAVKRGVEFAAAAATSEEATTTPLLIGDMPFGSYEFEDTDIALQHAYQFIKEGGMDAVKLEGGSLARARTAQRIVEGGVAVMGHIGLTPQAISVLGGFRAQGRTAIRARALLDDALRLQDAGVFSIVLECVPANVAGAITNALEIPTIGIGAGGKTSGQVLVYHDMLGMLSHPHHEEFVPKFCKRYAQVGHTIQDALREYRDDVERGNFPGEGEYSPYVMTEEEKHAFDTLLKKDEEERQRKHDEAAVKLTESDEYESLRLYGNSNNNNNNDDNK